MEQPQKTILVVEDEKSMLKALVDKFSGEGFRMLEAKNGQEGLEIALKERPDLILLDIVMPKMDGMTMLKQLRQDFWGKQSIVIILTNLTVDNNIMMKITESEPSYYLVKSDWKMDDLVVKVRTALGMNGIINKEVKL